MNKRFIMAAAICLALFFTIGLIHPQAAETSPEQEVIRQIYGLTWKAQVLDDADGQTIGGFSLSTAMKPASTEEVNYTFTDELPLTGSGAAGDTLNLVVFTVDGDGEPIIWYQTESVLGSSGLFQENVPLVMTGEQMLMIGVTEENGIFCRFYTFSRKNEAVEQELLDYHLNLYEEFGR